MKVAGKCLSVGPGKGGAIIVTIVNELDDEKHEVDVRCWGDRFHQITRTLKQGDRVVVEGFLQTKSWQRDGDPRPPMRFTSFNAYTIAKEGNEAPLLDGIDDPPPF